MDDVDCSCSGCHILYVPLPMSYKPLRENFNREGYNVQEGWAI